MIRIASINRNLLRKSCRHLTSQSRSTSSIKTNESVSRSNDLSHLLSPNKKLLLQSSHELAATSRSLARRAGVTVREDTLLNEIVKLRRQCVDNTRCKGGDTNHELDTTNEENNSAMQVPPPLFTVVFAGEFNSGKSTLINALLGEELLESGVLPTTDSVTVLMGHDDAFDASLNQTQDEVSAERVASKKITDTITNASTSITNTTTATNSSLSIKLYLLPTKQYPILSSLLLIDTPGTNAILSQHTSTTLQILHNADILIFITSADRPFTESEQKLLQLSGRNKQQMIVVVNKIDLLERSGGNHGDVSKKKVVEYVEEHVGELVGRVVVLPVSGRDALSYKLLFGDDIPGSDRSEEDGIWKRSNFGVLETYLRETLTASSKIKTKLLNPIGVAEGMLLECQTQIQQRKDDLEVDVMTLRLLNSQSTAWEKELKSEVLDECRNDVRNYFVKWSEVVDAVFGRLTIIDHFKMGLGLGKVAFDTAWDDSISQCRGVSLGKQSNSTKQNIEQSLFSILDKYAESITSRSRMQGELSIEYLGKRPAVIGSKGDNGIVLGRITAPKFTHLQSDLNESFIKAVQNSTTTLCSEDEWSNRIYSLLCRSSLLSTVLFGSAAIGPIAFTQTNDITIATALSSSLLVLGGLTIPLGNRYITILYSKEWMGHAEKLDASLQNLFEQVMKQVSSQLAESVSPYSRFVNGEGDHLKELRREVESGLGRARVLRKEIDRACDL